MEMNGERQCPPSGVKIKKKSCCEDLSEYFKLLEEVTHNDQQLDLVKLDIDYSLAILNQHVAPHICVEGEFQYACYKPPLIVCDVVIDIQTFLC